MPQKPKLGQHFLVSPSAPARIVNALGPLAGRAVIEIGPGTGAITRLLAQRAEYLTAIEYDHQLAAALQRQYSASDTTRVMPADILAVNLAEISRETQRRLLIVGNLPYYITSDILLHLFAHHAVIERAVLMVQREVAHRVAAQPGSREYGLLSATSRLYSQVEILFDLPPEDFAPPPQVHSTVLRLTMAPRFAELGVPPALFQAFLRHCFAQKRKTLANNLRSLWPEPAAQAAFSECGLDPRARAETLDLPQMACLFRHLQPPSLN